MNYTAIHRDWLRSGAALDASDAAIGAWARLHSYAADLEVGEPTDNRTGTGRLPACADWSDRAWLAAACTTREGVACAVGAGLAEWDGDDLLVHGYDSSGQRGMQAKRRNGGMGGRPVKVARKPKPNPRLPTSENGGPGIGEDRMGEDRTARAAVPSHSDDPDTWDAARLVRIGYTQRYADRLGHTPSPKSLTRTVPDVATWVRENASMQGCSERELADRLLDGLFARPDLEPNRWPLAFVAEDPAEFLGYGNARGPRVEKSRSDGLPILAYDDMPGSAQ